MFGYFFIKKIKFLKLYYGLNYLYIFYLNMFIIFVDYKMFGFCDINNKKLYKIKG